MLDLLTSTCSVGSAAEVDVAGNVAGAVAAKGVAATAVAEEQRVTNLAGQRS